MFYVYILKSLKNRRFYTGSTVDLERRLREHNQTGSGYTKLTRPFVLVHYETFLSRTEAVQRELYLKTGMGREWIYSQFR